MRVWISRPFQDETQAGGVKHNREMAPGDGEPSRSDGKPGVQRQQNQQQLWQTICSTKTVSPQAAAASTDGVELDITFGFPVEEKPIWVDL